MDRLISKLILFGNMPKDSILMELSSVCKELHSGEYDKEVLIEKIYHQVKRILEVSTSNAFDKNLWHNYLTFQLMCDENPFTLTSEKEANKGGSVNHFALNDFHIFRELFNYDFTWIEESLGIDCFSVLNDYHAIKKPELMYNTNISEKVRGLSEALEQTCSDEEFFKLVTDFYRDFGVGLFGLNKAFRISEGEDGRVVFHAINNMDKVVLSDLVGYEIQKKKLTDNTKAFVQGRKANNVLLYGDSGTGKSTSIKAITNEYYPEGLRMIEIYKHQFKLLSTLIAQIKNRNYKFIIYMDDLSFEEDESDYKFLKAVIEGGVETKPGNILIYATSNRRHLIKETFSDRNDMQTNDDIHHSDTVEEKMSLVNRFGVTIGYTKPRKDEFINIVKELAARNRINMPEDELELEAGRWELRHGGRSGRSAQQFIDYLCGQGYNE